MMTTGMSRGGPATYAEHDRASTTQWSVFGSVMLMLLATINVIHGITALQYDELLTADLVYDNLTFWGWAFIVWGALQFAGGVATMMGRTWGPSLGMTLATVSAFGWFFMIFTAPAAAVVGVVLSVSIIASLSSAVAE